MKILFVCLGNYCRSPIAHAIAKHIFPNWTIDSCALSHCHEGEQMHINSRKILKKHEMFYDVISKHISKVNIKNFDLVLCMDFSNYVKLNGLGIKCAFVFSLKYFPFVINYFCNTFHHNPMFRPVIMRLKT